MGYLNTPTAEGEHVWSWGSHVVVPVTRGRIPEKTMPSDDDEADGPNDKQKRRRRMRWGLDSIGLRERDADG